MALPIFQQGAFNNTANMTPAEVERKRAYIAAMMPKFGSAKYVGEGLGQLATGVVIGRQNKKLDGSETAGRKSAEDMFSRLFGTANSASSPDVQGPLSVLGMTPDQTAAAPQPADPSTPAGLGDAAMAAIGKPAQHDHAASHPGTSHGDWLKYSNQSATRNDPLDPALIDAMAFLPEMGITMDVISGGQEAAGTPGGKRTGSTRHDHGKSGDVDFYKDGRKLDWNNAADLPVLQEIVRTAKARGVTGIGAGDDYMGAGRFHVGFGNPAVWGAGGSSANAPAWLVEAYNGAPAGAAPAASAPTAPAAPAPQGGGIPMAELQAAMMNPWLMSDPAMAGVIQAEFERQSKQSDPMYQLQLQQAQLELQKAQQPEGPPEEFTTRMFTLNSLGIDPQSEEGKVYLMTGKLPEADGASNVPAGFATLDMQAQAAGYKPGTPEYQEFMRNGGGSGAPAAFIALDLQAQAAGFEPGTPEYKEFMATRGAGLAAAATEKGKASAEAEIAAPGDVATADTTLGYINSIRNHPGRGMGTGGSSWVGMIPGTGAKEFQVEVERLKSGAFMTAIEQLRGMGALSNAEGQTATAAVAALDPSGTEEGFLKRLAEYEEIVKRGRDRAARRIKAPADAAPVSDSDAGGWTVLPNGVKVRVKQ